MQPNLTISILKKLLETRSDGVLHAGQHDPPNGECKMCVRELRCLAIGMDEWTDRPDGNSPTDRACRVLNDAPWSSDAARTEACLPLALLSEKTAPDGWVARYAERTIKEILPISLRMAAEKMVEDSDHQRALLEAAHRCEREGSRDSAEAARAAADAAGGAAAAAVGGAAAHAAYCAIDAHAAHAARYAHAAASLAARRAAAACAGDAGDQVLRKAVQILIECHKF